MKCFYITIILLTLLISMVIACSDVEKTTPEQRWQLVFEENFGSSSALGSWHLDGFANLRVVTEDSISYLEIETYPSGDNSDNKQSVLWLEKRFSGDLRFQFRVRATDRNRSIFFFQRHSRPRCGFQQALRQKFSGCTV